MDLKNFFKNTFHKDLSEIDLCVKGWNWGDISFKGSILSFNVDGKPAFEVPLKEVSQVWWCVARPQIMSHSCLTVPPD